LPQGLYGDQYHDSMPWIPASGIGGPAASAATDVLLDLGHTRAAAGKDSSQAMDVDGPPATTP